MKRVVRSTNVPIAERLPFPMIESPSLCPGTSLLVTSAGLSRIMTMSGKRLVRCSFRRRGRRRVRPVRSETAGFTARSRLPRPYRA